MSDVREVLCEQVDVNPLQEVLTHKCSRLFPESVNFLDCRV